MRSISRPLIAGLFIPALLVAARPGEDVRGEALYRDARAHLAARAFQLGLDQHHDFVAKNIHSDELGRDHVRVHQTFQGVRVFEGEAILHLADGGVRHITDDLVRSLRLNVQPSLDTAEALAAAHGYLAPKGAYAAEPTAELVITTLGNKARPTLAYHVHTELENGADETAHTDLFISARTGAVLKAWSTLHTGKPGGGASGTAAVGTGASQYSGNVSLNTTKTSTGYAFQDLTRGGGNKVYNLNHGTSGTGTLYTDADNGWGDGRNYTEGSSTTAANGQTAAVDAGYGVQVTWDMYKKVFNRNGIDGNGSATYSRVHYSSSYDNAFWSDRCFCMTYGDGNSFTTLTSMDVAGHEMTHGVTSRTANLTYSGESGGLNESHSDIFGTMAEFYRGSSGTTIPATGGNWTIGEQLASKPLRYMAKPSSDGRSPDAWSSNLGSLDVHYSSGPMNRCFYFLSQGAASSASPYLPGGMTGLGNDKAARIAYLALSGYMTSNTNYAGARTAYLNAAKALYGTGSAEATAVANAFKAINVN